MGPYHANCCTNYKLVHFLASWSPIICLIFRIINYKFKYDAKFLNACSPCLWIELWGINVVKGIYEVVFRSFSLQKLASHVHFNKNLLLLQYLLFILYSISIKKEKIAKFIPKYHSLIVALFLAKIISTIVSMRGPLTKPTWFTFQYTLY